MSEFSLRVQCLETDQLIERFTELKRRAPDVSSALRKRNLERTRDVEEQFARLSSLLFPVAESECGACEGRVMKSPEDAANRMQYYKNDFWSYENTKYARPHFRLQKSARIVNRVAGRGRATFSTWVADRRHSRGCSRSNISYYGIDIAIQDPAPNLLEADILENTIKFE